MKREADKQGWRQKETDRDRETERQRHRDTERERERERQRNRNTVKAGPYWPSFILLMAFTKKIDILAEITQRDKTKLQNLKITKLLTNFLPSFNG